MGAERKKEFLSKTKKEFYEEIRKAQNSFKPTKEIEGYGGSAIVGEKNYPLVSTYNISNEEKESSYDKTSELVKQPYKKIFSTKAKNILGSTPKNSIKKPKNKIIEEIKDIYKSKKIIKFSSEFEKELLFTKPITNKVAGIMGSENSLQSLEATENTSTSNKIEKYTQDDIKAKEAILSLYKQGYNEHQIINILALGGFGIQSQRKLVPTKWAISAYDQTIEKYLYSQIKRFNPISNYEIYTYHDKGNDFVIIFLPDTFSAEIIETWDNVIERDYVNHHNILNKNEPETAGGFWATKCGIHEHFYNRKKQGAYISIRIIKNYEIPLGVVFVRECVREALKKKPDIKTSNKEEFEKYIQNKFPKHYKHYLFSKTLKEKKIQKKLNYFFN